MDIVRVTTETDKSSKSTVGNGYSIFCKWVKVIGLEQILNWQLTKQTNKTMPQNY